MDSRPIAGAERSSALLGFNSTEELIRVAKSLVPVTPLHPWHAHYRQTFWQRVNGPPISRIIAAETIETIQAFRNKTILCIDRVVVSSPPPPGPVLRDLNAMEEPVGAVGALYVLLSCGGNEMTAVPLHKEVAALDRPDLLQLVLNEHAKDQLNPEPCNMGNYMVGDLIFVSGVHKRPKATMEQFNKVVGGGGDPFQFKFWNIAEFTLVTRTFEKNVLITVVGPGNKHFKTRCIAMDCHVMVAAREPVFGHARISRAAGTKARADFFVPPRQPGQLLDSIRHGKSKFFVAEKTASHPLYPTIHPTIRKVRKLTVEDAKVFRQAPDVCRAYPNLQLAFRALIKAARLGLSGIAAVENMNLDRSMYSTRITEVMVTAGSTFLRMSISTPSGTPRQASWTRSTEVTMETGVGFFSMTVESAISTKTAVLLETRLRTPVDRPDFDPTTLNGQNVLITQVPSNNGELLRLFPKADAFDHISSELPGMKVLAALTGGEGIQPAPMRTELVITDEGALTMTEEQSQYINRLARGQEAGIIAESAIGSGKMAMEVTAAACVSRQSRKVQMITTITNDAVVKVVAAHLQMDPEGRCPAVRLISKANRERMDECLTTELDYPVIWKKAFVDFIQLADGRLGANERPRNLDLLTAAIFYCKACEEAQNLSNSYLRAACMQKRAPQLTTFEVFMRVYQPKLIIGTTASILDAFQNQKWSKYAHLVETIQVNEASQFPLHALISLVACFPSSRYAFIGDRHQLPPYANQELPEDLRTFAVGNLLETATRRNSIPRVALTTVFRCPPQITRICSDVFYSGRLRSARALEFSDRFPLQIVDIRTPHKCVAIAISEPSLINEGEAEVAVRMAKRIHGVRSIGVLCFYKAQAELVATKFRDEPHGTFFVRTVDASQGHEYDVVLILTTRSDVRSSQFLADRKRINVALSRAKSFVAILGNAKKLMEADVWKDVLRSVPVTSAL